MKDKYTPARLGNYTFSCQICAKKEWASNSKVLSTYTGHGGLRVCPACNDAIDFGLVPYTIPAEKSVPWATDAYYTGTLTPIAVPETFPTVNFDAIPNSDSLTPYELIAALGYWDVEDGIYWNNDMFNWDLDPNDGFAGGFNNGN